LLVEPQWAVQLQANFWSIGYAGFVLACLGVVAFTWKVIPGTVEPQSTQAATTSGKAPSWGDCLLWLGLAATASILLLALTRHMTQDVAPVPFLWVLPLGIYLLSFILCFDAPQFYLRSMYLISLPFALIWLDSVVEMVGMSAPILVALLSMSLFIFCMVCHGELVRRKPPVQYLTLFYLMISLGGALGGLLVGLVAPAVFNAYFELPIGLFLMSVLVVILLWREYRLPIRMLLVVSLIIYGIRLGTISMDYVDGYRVVVRNFYGQLRIDDREDKVLGPVRAMFHGRIIHGEEALAPKFQNQPTSYYCVGSGIERSIRSLPSEPARKIGVIGLGAGTLAAYGRKGDVMRIYEINEQVLDLARTEFNYLKRSQAEIVPVLGDGRLMLERESPQQFDLLVLDAFSGDSIPTHLVTLEAIEIYLRHLKPGGILAFHTTNTYLDLRPVMAAAGQAFDRNALAFTFMPDAQSPLCRRSEWTVLHPTASGVSASVSDWERLPVKATFKPWTDSYSNLLGILR
jgi:SAM-dependent methyltransferase